MSFWPIRSEIRPAFDGGLMQAQYLIGGVHVVMNKTQRNNINLLRRQLNATSTTLAVVLDEGRIYKLINNPNTTTTTDSDWEIFFIGETSSFRPIGEWDADNDNPVLQDSGAFGINGQFYFVTNAPTQRDVTYAGLFDGQTETVVNGDLIVSVGDKWVVVTSSVTWDALVKPSVIDDYVNGIVIPHTHVMSDITGLADALALKYDVGDTADHTIPFETVPDTAITEVEFLKQWYYTKSEIEDIINDLEDGGITTFLGLLDTPNDYTGQNLKLVRVNSLATALEFVDHATLLPVFNNGLNSGTPGYVRLGGTIIEDTLISLDATNPRSLTITDGGLQSAGFIVVNSTDPNTITGGASMVSGNLSISVSEIEDTLGVGIGMIIFDGRGTPKGLQYSAANYVTTDRSLTDRGYVLGAKTFTGKQTFTATSSVAGINVGSIAGVPSTVVNGDIWYDTTGNRFRVGSSSATFELIVGAVDSGEVVFGQATGRVTTDDDFTYNSTTNQLNVPTISVTSITGTVAISVNQRMVFTPSATVEGLTVGSIASDPSAPNNGGIWYNTANHEFKGRINGVTRTAVYTTTPVANRVPFFQSGSPVSGLLDHSSSFGFNSGTGALSVPWGNFTTTSTRPAISLGAGISGDPTNTSNFDIWSSTTGPSIRTKINSTIYNMVVIGTTAVNRVPYALDGNGRLTSSNNLTFTNGDTLNVTGIATGFISLDGNMVVTILTDSLFITNAITGDGFSIAPDGTVDLTSTNKVTLNGGGQSITVDAINNLTTINGTSTLIRNSANDITYSHQANSLQMRNAFTGGETRITLNNNASSEGIELVWINGAENTQLEFKANGQILITDDRSSKAGLEYAAAGYVTQARSLTDKAYVDTAVAGAWKITGTTTLTGAVTIAGGFRTTFSPSATLAGLNVGSFAGTPSTLVNGDVWYNSSSHYYGIYVNGTARFVSSLVSADAVANRIPIIAATSGTLTSSANLTWITGSSTLSATSFRVTGSTIETAASTNFTLSPIGTGPSYGFVNSGTTVEIRTPSASATNVNLIHLINQTQTQSSGVITGVLIANTYNQTSTAASIDLDIRRTETAIGSGSHLVMRVRSGSLGSDIIYELGNTGNAYYAGNLRIASANVSGTGGVLAIGNAASVPSANPSGANYLYSADVSSSSVLHIRNQAGDIIRLLAAAGWDTPTGTLDRTSFDPSTVTLSELGERVAALITDLKTVQQLLKA